MEGRNEYDGYLICEIIEIWLGMEERLYHTLLLDEQPFAVPVLSERKDEGEDDIMEKI